MARMMANTIPVRVGSVRVMVHERISKTICIQAWQGKWRVFHTEGRFKTVTVDDLDHARMFAEAHA